MPHPLSTPHAPSRHAPHQVTLSVWLTRDMRTVQLCTQREREGRELIDSASWDKDGAPGRLEAPSRPRPQGRALKAAPQLATPAWPGQTTKNGAALPCLLLDGAPHS